MRARSPDAGINDGSKNTEIVRTDVLIVVSWARPAGIQAACWAGSR